MISWPSLTRLSLILRLRVCTEYKPLQVVYRPEQLRLLFIDARTPSLTRNVLSRPCLRTTFFISPTSESSTCCTCDLPRRVKNVQLPGFCKTPRHYRTSVTSDSCFRKCRTSHKLTVDPPSHGFLSSLKYEFLPSSRNDARFGLAAPFMNSFLS